MIRVICAPAALKFPRECACCLTPTDHVASATLRTGGSAVVVHWETTYRQGVPYCPACLRHAIWYQEFGFVGLAMRSLSAIAIGSPVLALGFLLISGSLPRELRNLPWLISGSLLGGLVLAAWITWRRLRFRPNQPLGDGHARKGAAVFLSSASNGQLAIDLCSDDYARRVAALSGESTTQQLRPDAHDWRERLRPLAYVVVYLAVLACVLLSLDW